MSTMDSQSYSSSVGGVDPATTALICLGFQNETMKPGGVFYESVQPVLTKTHTLLNTEKLQKEALKRGVAVIHVPLSFSYDYKEIRSDSFGILREIVSNKAYREGTWGVKIVDELSSELKRCTVVEGRKGMCGFSSTNLDFILRNKGITNVAVCGCFTNQSVESTVRTAFEKGYSVFAITNCTATDSVPAQRASLEVNLPLFSKCMSGEAFIKAMSR